VSCDSFVPNATEIYALRVIAAYAYSTPFQLSERNPMTRKNRRKNEAFDREAPAFRIAMLWGSNAAFAAALGRTHSTTQRWLLAGDIPPEYHEDVIAAAKRDKKKLRPEDFIDRRKFDVPPAPPVEQAAAA
jgi:hypothetical protein